MKNVKKWDIAICVVLGGILGIFILELRDITPIARVYPIFVITGSYIMLAIVVFRAIRGNKAPAVPKASADALPSNEEASGSESALEKTAILRIGIYCGAILVYILLIDILGYILSTVAFAVFSLLFMQNKNKIVLVALPVVFALAMYFIFAELLYVRLPAGEVFAAWG